MFHNFGKLNISGIPQSRISCHGASLFMGFFWAMLLVGVDSEVTDPKEVGALLALKQNLIDPNGNLSDWSRGDPCASSWRGVLCFDRPVIDGHLHVGSFGGFLLAEDILTHSFPPRDLHKAQIQFALERGVPAFVAMLGTRRIVTVYQHLLPY